MKCVCCHKLFDSLSKLMKHLREQHSDEEVMSAIDQQEQSQNGSQTTAFSTR